MADQPVQQITLPERLVSSVDLSRTIRELEALDESMRQAALRKPGEPTKLSRSSVTLEELARENGVQLTDATQREQLIGLLHGFMDHAPRIHMSVAAEPSAAFSHRVTIWLRQNIHPLTLLEIGLQPTLAAGCIIRTNNKLFDMSLRHRFKDNRGILYEKISAIGEQAEAKEEKAAIEAAIAAQPSQPTSAQVENK